VNLYAESSAVLAWLLGEPAVETVNAAFDQAEGVFASDLTLVECHRVLVRAYVTGELGEMEALRRRTLLEAVSAHWTFLKVDREILERARHRLPVEPVRTLDALHLASALAARSLVTNLTLLSLDQRVRDNGVALGFDVLPA
jgi:predicted nucleic acid-binding protein